jgi:hypothetical protein
MNETAFILGAVLSVGYYVYTMRKQRAAFRNKAAGKE